VCVRRVWKAGDTVDLTLPMRTTLEQMPDRSNYYAVLHGPIVLAAKTRLFANEQLNFTADDARMGHIAQGPVCPLEAAPLFVSNTRDFAARFRPVKGQPLTFTAPGLIHGGGAPLQLIPFFRLHDARYTMYFPHSTPANLASTRAAARAAEAGRRALAERTIDQVAPGEQQPESDHGYAAEGGDSGINKGRRWRHATGWFSYVLTDKKREGRVLRLTLASGDAGRQFDVEINGKTVAGLALESRAGQDFYDHDIAIPPALGADILMVRFVAKPGSIAGGVYGLRLLRKSALDWYLFWYRKRQKIDWFVM
jgi:hypothetical protein